MANWAALQEQLVGKPVFKRAKHGIHFQNNDGSITANFSGKPCHFQDNGIWKPIDTALLATPDGWYSSPHSDVVIHPDGRVRVKGSDYQQFTKLPSAKKGVLDGDKIVRTFPGGEQHLIMKEDGFKEEIHVFKPKFPIEKFIAKTSGSLPSKYKAHPITAEDAEGNTYEFTGDVKEFGAWLDKAVYPVVIDPDFNITDGVGADTFVSSVNATNNYGIYPWLLTRNNTIVQLMRFDLSSVPSTAVCSAAKLAIYPSSNEGSATYNIYQITDENGDWIEGTKGGATAGSGEPCWNAKKADGSGGVTEAWAGSAGLKTAGTDYIDTVIATATSALTGNTAFEIPFNESGLAVLQSWFGDATNNGFILVSENEVFFYSGENATTAYRPILTVTYEVPASGIPKHFMHYQRLRSL